MYDRTESCRVKILDPNNNIIADMERQMGNVFTKIIVNKEILHKDDKETIQS